MAKKTANTIRDIRTAVGRSDALTAWSLIEPLLRFPDCEALSADELSATWAYFQRTVGGLGLESLEPLIDNARNNPDSPKPLLDLGQELLRHDMAAIAATPLTHASRLISQQSPHLDDVTTALETALQRSEAGSNHSNHSAS